MAGSSYLFTNPFIKSLEARRAHALWEEGQPSIKDFVLKQLPSQDSLDTKEDFERAATVDSAGKTMQPWAGRPGPAVGSWSGRGAVGHC